MNSLARDYYYDFRDFVDRFSEVSKGIKGILKGLSSKQPKERFSVLITARTGNFKSIFENPLNDFKKRLDNLYWKKKEMNYEFLSCLVKEFENYVTLHKLMYVDFAVVMAREIGLDNVTKTTKRVYTEYKDNYNDFIFAYTEFAKRCSRIRFRIFNEKLPKANEL